MEPAQNPEASPWYRDGLRFRCTQCGDCCTGEPGYVWVDAAETQTIADFVKVSPEQFVALYTRVGARGRTLRENARGDCVFYEHGTGCTIYSVRPRQCRTWPFWESNVRSPEDWDEACMVCPGSGEGDLISAEEITRRLRVIRL